MPFISNLTMVSSIRGVEVRMVGTKLREIYNTPRDCSNNIDDRWIFVE